MEGACSVAGVSSTGSAAPGVAGFFVTGASISRDWSNASAVSDVTVTLGELVHGDRGLREVFADVAPVGSVVVAGAVEFLLQGHSTLLRVAEAAGEQVAGKTTDREANQGNEPAQVSLLEGWVQA
jgi:hypothetical protein